MGNNQTEPLSDVIKRRNELLELFFRECDLPVRIIGDPQRPAIVYNEEAFLSVYVSNFDLHFTLTPGGKKSIAVVKLRKQHGMNHERLMNILEQATHKSVIKIKIQTCYLCVIGYNFQDRVNSEGRFPVFGRYGHKVYFNKGYVDQLVAELNAECYNVEAYIPAHVKPSKLKVELFEE